MKFPLTAAFLFALAGILIAQTTPETPESSAKAPKANSFAALLLNSPFKAAAKNKTVGKKLPVSRLQFRGLLTINGQTEFGLYDAQSQRCYWLKLQERDEVNGIFIESYNAELKSLNVRTSSGTLALTLASPDEKPLLPSSKMVYNPSTFRVPANATAPVQAIQVSQGQPANQTNGQQPQRRERPRNSERSNRSR